MNIAETAGVIKDKAVTYLRDLRRGYSDAELRRELRISHSDILPDDRLKFKSDETDRISNLILGVGLYSSPLSDSQLLPFYSPGINSFLEQVQGISNLPDADIDQLLAEQARAKLESWHWHKKKPRIVNPSSHFIRKS